MDDFLPPQKSENKAPIPITPIMDMFVAIVFFLLLSSSFYKLTQQELPQIQTAQGQTTQSSLDPDPTLLVSQHEGSYQCRLIWGGNKPGQRLINIVSQSPEEDLKNISTKISQLVAMGQSLFPKKNSLKIGLTENLPHQVLISALDGIRKFNLGVILISPEEVKGHLVGEVGLTKGGR